MALRIKTNIDSMIAQKNLENNSTQMQSSIEKLSSGFRINKSADDAAGLAISENMRAKVRAFSQVKRNASDGISYLQIGEGGLSELSNVIIRMRELTTQSASDTLSAHERDYLNNEFTELGKEVVRIKNNTEFNGRYILSRDDNESMVVQIGANLRQEGVEAKPETEVVNINVVGINALSESLEKLTELNIQGESGQEIGGSAEDIFSSLDDSMSKIMAVRAGFGALQSRLFSAISSIDVANENLSAAVSRIKDTDYAAETASFTQNKILVSAGTSVLSQANQIPEQALPLLR